MAVTAAPQDRGVRPQVKLPWSVAFEVVMQGLRIRFGRSLVTLTGVACGIAFLSSVLAGQRLRRGVAEEDALRAETGRIIGFIQADLPPWDVNPVALAFAEPPDTITLRTLQDLARKGARFEAPLGTVPSGPDVPDLSFVKGVPAAGWGQAAAFVLVVGRADGTGSPALDFRELLDGVHRPWASLTSLEELAWKSDLDAAWNSRTEDAIADPPPLLAAGILSLLRSLTDEEKERKARDEREESVRGIWIMVVALLVTTMGIANALLMSVTERFREIGTMKCLGALSGFIRRVFLLESALLGLVGGLLGALGGIGLALAGYSIGYGTALVMAAAEPLLFVLYGLVCTVIGVALSMVAALYPANIAAGMTPATALRSNV